MFCRFLCLALLLCPSFVIAADRPNIVVILLDNVGREWFGCYGSEEKCTPNIDKLAAGGVRFANCYTTTVCGPSRVQMLTGRYPFRTGWYLHHDAALYSGRQVILTPLPQTTPELVQKATDCWAAIGAQVLRMTPENHDAAFAAVSHLPHVLAFACFNAIAGQTSGKDYLSLAGPGFRDFTRIAASDPVMWRDVFLTNREAVLDILGRFAEELFVLQRAIRMGDGPALFDYFTRTRAIRRGIIEAGQDTAAPDFGRTKVDGP